MNRSLVGLMTLFVLAFTLFISLVIFEKPISRLTRAKEEFIVSEKSTLIFAWPLATKADGKSKSTVTVFVRSSAGKPLADKVVKMSGSMGTVDETESVSDKEGKSVFHISSNTPGVSNITVTVDNTVTVLQPLSIKFELSNRNENVIDQTISNDVSYR